MKNKVISAIIILTIGLFTACKQSEEQVDFELSVPVSVMVLKPTVIEEYINATGTVFPVYEATLSSRIEGDYFLQVNPRTGKLYALGDMVEEGDVIVKLKDDEYKNQIKIETKKLNWELSEMEYEKQKSLYEKGGVTLRELKNSEIAFANAKIDYDNAKINLAKMNVVAPFKAMLTEIPYFTNSTRVSSNTELVKIMYYQKLLMYVNLPEKNYSQVAADQKVVVTNYSMPDDTLYGVIEQISPAIDPDARTFKCVVSIDNPDYKLLPGMFVKADLVINRMENVMVIPKEIVRSKGSYNSVFVIDDGAAKEKGIRLGISNGGDVMVSSGLDQGDRVVIKGYETLRNRSKVKIMNEEVQETEDTQAKEGEKPEGVEKSNEKKKRNKE